jgi:hypothetical protein
MQQRAVTGFDFENSLISEQWSKKEIKPKMIWDVPGRNIFDKMKNVNYDVTKFNLSDNSILSKSDFISTDGNHIKFEVKKYYKKQLSKWTLYSEPFFKVADKKQAAKIDRDTYNNFVSDFILKRQDIIQKVLTNITKGNIGIRCLDGLILQDELEYKVVVMKGWKDYNRISIMCRLKNGLH